MVSELVGRDPLLTAEMPAYLSAVSIGYGHVPRYLQDAVVRGVLYEASTTEALLEVPDIARLHIRRDAVIVEPLRGGSPMDLGPYLRRTPLMALAMLNGGFCVNGAAVAGPDGAVVVIGRTVSGKSTLAAALMKRGLRLMADDAAILSLGQDGVVRAFSVWPEMILWQEAVAALFGSVPQWLTLEGGEVPRYRVSHEWFCAQAMPVKRIYVLRPSRLETAIHHDAATGFSSLVQGQLLPYHSELAAALVDRAVLLRLYGAVDCGKIQTLTFPQHDIAEMDDLAQRLIEDCGWSTPT